MHHAIILNLVDKFAYLHDKLVNSIWPDRLEIVIKQGRTFEKNLEIMEFYTKFQLKSKST